MPLPSFTVTGDLSNILGGASDLNLTGMGGTVTFTPNVPEDAFVTWAGDLYRVRVASSGFIDDISYTLLANDPGLSITGLQWRVDISPDTFAGNGTMRSIVFDAPADGETVDLATVAPAVHVPASGVAGLTEPQLLSLIADSGSDVRDALDAVYIREVMRADFTTMSAIASPTTGGTATLTRTRTGADPVLTSGRYVSSDTASGTSASHWTKGLPDGGRILWAEARFEMVGGSTTGQVFTIVLWESNMPAGLLGALVNRGPAHVVFYPNGWLVETVDTSDGGLVTPIGSAHTYSVLPGSAVQTVTLELDVAAQMCYVTGADGVRVGIGPDSRFATVPAYFADAEILYTAANTDARIKVLEFDADSVVGGRVVGSTAIPFSPLPTVVLNGYYGNAWAAGQMGTPGYIDRARTFTKIRYVPSAAGTGTFTAELRNANDGSTYAATSGTSAASAKYKEVTGTFKFASRDMPYVQMTAVSGSVGIGCDVWLIP